MFSESPWHIAGFLRKIDRFGYPIPTFNIKGADKVKTAIGGILTATIMTFTLGYFIIKMQALIKGSDPIINENTIKNYYEGTDSTGVNLYTANQRFAISIFDGVSLIPKFDSTYVNLVAKLVTQNEFGKNTFIDYQLHDCTDEDWELFYPPEIETVKFFKARQNLFRDKLDLSAD